MTRSGLFRRALSQMTTDSFAARRHSTRGQEAAPELDAEVIRQRAMNGAWITLIECQYMASIGEPMEHGVQKGCELPKTIPIEFDESDCGGVVGCDGNVYSDADSGL